MNLALSDEQEFLREAARGALSRHQDGRGRSRGAGGSRRALPDLWPTAVEAGWPGLLIDEDHGGAGLGAFDAMLVAEECGRVLASVPLLGLLPATAILDAAGDASLPAVAAGELRPAYVPTRPPGELEPRWTAEPRSGLCAVRRPPARVDGDEVVLDGAVAFVPDAPGAGPAGRGRRRRTTASRSRWRSRRMPMACDRARDALRRHPVAGHVTFSRGPGPSRSMSTPTAGGRLVPRPGADRRRVARRGSDLPGLSVAYAKERFTFGRAIGSYQSIKHELTEVLRRMENARGLQYYAGLGAGVKPDEFPLAASAARSAAGEALDFARALDDQRARRHRRDLGARRAAVLPPRRALSAAAGRHPRRD